MSEGASKQTLDLSRAGTAPPPRFKIPWSAPVNLSGLVDSSQDYPTSP